MIKYSIITPARNAEQFILRALNSVPIRDDIEHIVIDDASEDTTLELVVSYKKFTGFNIVIMQNSERLRACGSINRALDVAQGEYIVQLDADDTFTPEMSQLMRQEHDEDVIFFCNRISNGSIWDPKILEGCCDHVCLYRRDIIGSTRHPIMKTGSGLPFHKEILAKNPRIFYSDLVCYNYNYPRIGSNLDLAKRGLL